MLSEADLTDTPRTLDWRAETVERGDSITGIIVGKLRKFHCHIYGKLTKPCVRLATDGKLACICETRSMELRVTGYIPIVTADKDRVVVVLSARPSAIMMKAAQGDVYKFSRPKSVKSAIRPRPLTGDEAAQAKWDRLRPTKNQDITEFLLHLWQLHDLTKHEGFVPRRPLKLDARHTLHDGQYAPRFGPGAKRTLGDTAPKTEAA